MKSITTSAGALRSLLSRVNGFVVKVEQLAAEAIGPRPMRARVMRLAKGWRVTSVKFCCAAVLGYTVA
jgi:hypothetical protein